MPESETRPHASETLTLASAFVVRWAEYTRAYSFYPPTNPRVVDAVESMLEVLAGAIREVGSTPEAGLAVRFPSDGIAVGSAQYDLPEGSPVRWLSERVHRAALAGVAFLPDIDPDTLGAFTRRLLQHFQRADLEQPFEALWPEVYPGIRLLDRRFDGVFDGSPNPSMSPHDVAEAGTGEGAGSGAGEAPQHEVASLIASHPAIRDQMNRLHAELDAHGSEDESTETFDVLAHIVDLLPMDAIDSQDQAIRIVEAVLRDLQTRLGQAAAGKRPRALASQALLDEIVKATSLGILGGRAPMGEAPRPPAPSPEQSLPGVNRAGDAGVMDSLTGLWDDMSGMAPPQAESFSPTTAESPDEQLGVYMHILVGLEEGERSPNLTAHLASLLSDGSPHRLQTLKGYLEATQGSVDSGFWRLISFLRERDLELMLRTSGFLSPATVTSHFPRHFGIYLEALNPADSAHRAELLRVLTEVGASRIRECAAILVDQEGVLEEPRVRRLLADASPEFLPLIRLMLQHGHDHLRAEAVEMLRRMRLDVHEADLLYVWDDPAGLPLEYLLTMADPERTRMQLQALHPLISLQIVRYLKATPDTPELEKRRLYAIQHLGTYFSKDADEILTRIVSERKFGVVFKESRVLRDAARRSLEMGRAGGRGE